MIDLYLQKRGLCLVPEDSMGAEELEHIANGETVRCQVTKPQNIAFHRKLFALFNVGYKYWQPAEIDCKYGAPEKTFDQFRKDVTILAGFYEIHHRLDGSFRVDAKSISYGKMSKDEKEKLYSNVINVLLQNIFTGYTEQDVVKMAEEEILNFA